ncbi:hypothetical protein GGS26DRAFT_541545 [Hypomontagnella submonticulosa]|nr:hypothetical protein GGS26DRAFT_541545 [Hypomontagnella submonticulosa]
MPETPELHAEPTQCESAGEAMPDIAGVGILLGLSVQAFISLVLSFWAFFLTKFGRLETQSPEGTPEHATEKKRLSFVSEILMVGNDLQMITGIALIITALTQGNALDLYHLHLVFDTVSFVGISNTTALVCWTFMRATEPTTRRHKKLLPAHWTPRFRVSYAFAVLFLALTVLLEVRLDSWSLEKAGHCYVTTSTAYEGAGHPWSDKVYVAVTAAWLLLVMFGALFCSVKFRKPILLLSALQFPVHLYMMIALRTANQGALEGKENENEWDFGQTTATILLGLAIGQLVHQGIEYVKFEHRLGKYGPEFALSESEKDPGYVTLMEEGLRNVRELKKSVDNSRLDISAVAERHEEQIGESHELISRPQNRAQTFS